MKSSKANTLVFLFPYSLTAFDADKFGLNFLRDKGIDVRVLDMTPLISTRSSHNNVLLTDDYIKKIHSYRELEHELRATANNAIYIDNINGINGFQWQGRKIFQLLKKHSVKYFVVEVGSLPVLNTGKLNIFNKLKKIFDLKKLTVFIKWKAGKLFAYYQWKYFNSFQLPQKIFIGSSDVLEQYLTKYSYPRKNVIPIHSYDYDRYLNYLRQNPVATPDNTCVFLDQMLATHSDFGKNVSFSPVTAKKYLESLNRFFAYVEQQTGLKIIIAASPRANYELTPEIFGHRTIIKGKTLELVANSSLVLLHTTTAVSFPILFNKPMLILKTDEMINAHGYANFIENMARALQLTPVNIDHQNELDALDLKNHPQWPRHYDDYQYKYVKSRNVEDRIIWEIVIDEFQRTSPSPAQGVPA
jgi:hypothetical protein